MPTFTGVIDSVFPSHEKIIRDYLAPDEVVILDDNPAIGEFLLVRAFWDLFFLGLGVAASIVLAIMGQRRGALVTFILADILVIRLLWMRLNDYYTRYVITDLRIIRTSGVFSRNAYSIPFGKITDVAFRQKFWERKFGYATIEIDSASEKSGLDKLRGLKDPARFNKVLVAMLADKQGYVVPGAAAIGKMRAREEQLKLELRFGRPRPELFPNPTDFDMLRAALAAQRDLEEKDDKLRHLEHLKRNTEHLDTKVAYPDLSATVAGASGDDEDPDEPPDDDDSDD
jgi:membrane protein YdbS with pleckstrin-like domain